jgi:hypothetical protein
MVFAESNIEALHSRHAFTPTRPPTPNMAGSPRKGTALELCCLGALALGPGTGILRRLAQTVR